MKTILCLEIDEKLFQDLSSLDGRLRKIINNSVCVNCKKPASNRIEYVKCSDGQIRWWHYRDGIIESCMVRVVDK